MEDIQARAVAAGDSPDERAGGASTSVPSPPPSSSYPSSSPSLGSSLSIPPNQTLYLKNLNEKTKIPELRKSLYLLFSQFGDVIEVRAVNNDHLRGQAWVIFADLSSATKALKEMQGFMFYHKPMQVMFAKQESDLILKQKGITPPVREKKKKESTAVIKQRKVAETQERYKEQRIQQHQHSAAYHLHHQQQQQGYGSSAYPGLISAPPPPHRVLFVEHLPPSTTIDMLNVLFSLHPGYMESRLPQIAGKPGIAFIEYENEAQATEAMNTLQGFKISPQHEIKITYAVKG